MILVGGEKLAKKEDVRMNIERNSTSEKVQRSTMASDKTLSIEVHTLTKQFGQDVLALNDLTFSVQKGEVFGLLGPNGAGKSTALKVMTTLSRPNQGDVWLNDVDVIRNPKEARKHFGYVAQLSGEDAESTGRENLMLQGRLYGLRGSLLKERVAHLLKQFNLIDVADCLSRTYSGGMQRKLDLAMGLIHRPQILFLDEPTTGLDPEARTDLWEIIQYLSREERLTVLLTTHYLEEADQLCDRLAIIDQGEVVVQGTAEMLKEELHGDIVHMKLMEAVSELQVKTILQDIQGLHEVIVDDLSLYVRTNHGAEQVPILMSKLESDNIKIQAVTISRPSLDDVYLRHTGHIFDKEEKKEV